MHAWVTTDVLKNETELGEVFLFCFYLSNAFTYPILGPLVSLFWISGDVSSGFENQSGFCLICITETNAMYIPWDPPLVLYIADLLIVGIVGRRPGSYLAQEEAGYE